MTNSIRTILNKALEKHLNEIGFKAGHIHLFIDQVQSEVKANYISKADISKIIDEAKPDALTYGCERCWSDDFKAKCTCDAESNAIKRAIDQYQSNLKEALE